MAVTARARQTVRWGLRHLIARRMIRRAARAGSTDALLMNETALTANPFPYYESLRRQGRLVDSGLTLAATAHDLCTAVLRSQDFGVVGGPNERVPAPVRWVVAFGGRGPIGTIEPPSMLAANPPDHTRYRRNVSRAFTARAVQALRTRTEHIAAELLDGMAARTGPTDLVAEYAALLPVTVISEMLGAPLSMREQFLEWGSGGALLLDPGLRYAQFRRSEDAMQAFHTWMVGHLAHLRREPGDNILSALVNGQPAEGGLTEDELCSIAILLLGAGFETTVNLLGSGAILLTSHPEQLERLRADPSLWPNAVEEILRFESPVQRTGRSALRDTVVAGERVAAGRMVSLLIGAANRDPAVFTEPQTFDIARANADQHLAFSSGIHYCLGAGLAKMEGEVGLRALFDRFPDLTPSGSPRRRTTKILRGYDAIPARLTATVDA
ncbi:cytochrome P450 [Pseudonocardia sp. GCM10023141]|uniref:cytochrome P450 n=1 Tax=Pseudonocardia sp. GCM10023141 TaxID=3252653 RepID=UPI00360D4604